MIYTVVWKPSAKQDLAAIWMAASNRNAVTTASHRIDVLLETDPDTRGTVLYDTVRALVVPPLGVEFEVIEDDRTVWVLSVWDASVGPTP